MASLALAYPILPGKTDDWRRMMAEVNGPRRKEYDASQRRVGVRSRVFLQRTPQGDLVLVTMDGADPYRSIQEMWTGSDPFSEWFVEKMKDIHGIDLREPPPGPLPELILDSDSSD